MKREVMHKILNYIGYGVAAIAIIVVIVCAEVLSREHRASQPVTKLKINITGGGEHPLADVESIDRWIKEAGLVKHNTTLETLNIGDIELRAKEHNAVAQANAHVDYNGTAVLDITLREPIARLRVNGYDLYITADGFILPTVEDATAAVPVITGGYTPLFRADYTGYASRIVTDSIASLDRVIADLEDAKLPYYRQLDENDAELREVLNESIRRGIFMDDREYRILVNELEGRKIAARERHSATKRRLEGEINSLTAQQQEARMKQRSVRMAGDDFAALVEFLISVDESTFWRAEIVQIMLSGGGDKRMELSFVPRSGSFVVDLGSPTELDTKLSNLYRFYNKGLDNVGWNKYRNISLRYSGQVVCR